MKRLDSGEIRLSAGDLANYLACRHLTGLDLEVALGRRGAPPQPAWRADEVEVLRERGLEHENAYLDYLASGGRSVERLAGDGGANAVEDAMRRGAGLIVQASLRDGVWFGRADILRRVSGRSRFGDWAYEAVDTKLARETKAGTILQLCLYSDLLRRIQGAAPENMVVVSPGTDPGRPFVPETFRVADFSAYYRLIRGRLEDAVRDGTGEGAAATYPEPVPHCDICRWQMHCLHRRRDDDHLSLVADLRRRHRKQFEEWNLGTLEALGSSPAPLPRPKRGSAAAYETAREQARVQLEGRRREAAYHELLDREAGRGLALLPAPAPGDLFFDIEGARFVGPRGLEYLFGRAETDESGRAAYRGEWAFDLGGDGGRLAVGEQRVFEAFVDFVMERWKQHPDMHIYHFAPYEPSAVKRLTGQFATRSEEVDRMLRAHLFVDLHKVVRQSLRASVEQYSIKALEPFYGFERRVELRTASDRRHRMERLLETGLRADITEEMRGVVEGYNRDDCVSLIGLRAWLEERRRELTAEGEEVSRPEATPGDASDSVAERDERVARLRGLLLAGLPEDPAEHDAEQRGRWTLAYLLDWHRREQRASWWEFFRLRDTPAPELRDEKKGLAGLKQVGRELRPRARVPIDIYEYEAQDTTVRSGETARLPGGKVLGSVVECDTTRRRIAIKKRRDTAEEHPGTIYAANEPIGTGILGDSLFRLGEGVAKDAARAEHRYPAALALLRKRPPRFVNAADATPGNAAETAIRSVLELDGEVLAIQGPPGTGKTRTGGHMICALVRAGKRVGVTANSHSVIRNLLDAAVREAKRTNLSLRCLQKVSGDPEDTEWPIIQTKDNHEVLEALSSGEASVAAGTAWLWSREDLEGSVDVLFVDEAGQMSLANTLAAAPAAKNLVLLGDPQQLDQPSQGAHPEGTDVSALGHLLGEHRTMPEDRGLFLDRTWRLSPSICDFTSEAFYEDSLGPMPGLERHSLSDAGDLDGYGLYYLPVEHEGNQSASPEEADRTATLVRRLLAGGVSWTNREGATRPLTNDDILIVSPYNAQLAELRRRLPEARIGTVDKFQGQEAPVVFYSMATSSAEDAPRGMDFLYSLNRLNVATSRAQCVTILVLNPRLFEPDCGTPHQMRLANALCRYRELARPIPADTLAAIPNAAAPPSATKRVPTE